MQPERPTEHIRHVDMTGLKALAHPLRVRILDALSTYGPFTASGLAERLGESSGSTSYHLRQLEKHGFVREDATRGSARERWWERSPDGIAIIETDFELGAPIALLRDFLRNGSTQLEKRWFEAATINTLNLRLTSEQLAQLVAEVETITERYAALYKKSDVPGSRPVQIQLNAFPVMDAEELPGADGNVGGPV
jgi:DNA-binding transcriptional ArsR family regulator